MELLRADGYSLSDDQHRLDVDRIAGWLGESYWAWDRDRATVERALRGSLAVGVYDRAGAQVGLARAITDGATYAWVADVVIDASCRGQGLGTWLVGALVEHLQGLGVARIMLATRDAHAVYSRLGFGPIAVPETMMEIDLRASRPRPEDVRLPPAR